MRYVFSNHARERFKGRVGFDEDVARRAFEHAVKNGHHLVRPSGQASVRYKDLEYVVDNGLERDVVLVVTVIDHSQRVHR